MPTILVLFALVIADPVSPGWEEVLTLVLPELVEYYEPPVRIDPRRRDPESGSATDLASDERRRRDDILQELDLEAVDFGDFSGCNNFLSMPPGLRADNPEIEARCAAMDLTGTSLLFGDPVQVEDGWKVDVSLAGDDFMGEASILITQCNGTWKLTEFNPGFIINYF